MTAGLSAFGQQTKVVQTPTRGEWDRIYDVIFPRGSKTFKPLKHEFAFDIRVDRPFQAPSQLSIVKFRNGGFEIYRYDMTDRSRSLFTQLMDLRESAPTKEYEGLARELAVEKHVPEKLPFIEAKTLDLFSCLGFTTQKDIMLDGTSLEMWYVDSGTNFYFQQSTTEARKTGESPLITYAREMMAASASPTKYSGR